MPWTGAVHDLQREAEDVAAVVNSIGEPANLLGHSYGGLCASEAALLTPNLRRLILYEGVHLRGADASTPGFIDRLDAMLEAGDVEGLLVAMLRERLKMPPEEIALLRSQQNAWAVRVANAPAIPRELRAVERYTFAPERFKSMRVPTLLLVGENSPSLYLRDAKGVANGLPDARVVVLPGQRHVAMLTAPELFVREVTRFLEE
jgi:pimeloyl-ACP methyl ester carboxylesterase